ncbi:MAG: dolichyl-phosphate-mannose--protein mannosyltransferase, partial [Gammaproteobacteria bacterium]
MKLDVVVDYLWGNRAKFNYLLLASLLLLFTCLGGREIWTQEHRWADIVAGMFYRHDFLHPYLGQNQYYDKPLLSYWAIALIAKLTGTLTTWVLRLPSALAGLVAVWSIYRLGISLKDKRLGLLSGWLLLTTFYFLFWARTSSADMLNLAGSLLAIAWYFDKTRLFS